MECIFCKIAQKQLPATLSYEDDQVVAFDDLNPQAPIHKLIIPRKHISTLNDITPADYPLLGHMLQAAQKLAQENGIAETGYRTVTNCNTGAGQTIFHLHFHLLGGRAMGWPPG